MEPCVSQVLLRSFPAKAGCCWSTPRTKGCVIRGKRKGKGGHWVCMLGSSEANLAPPVSPQRLGSSSHWRNGLLGCLVGGQTFRLWGKVHSRTRDALSKCREHSKLPCPYVPSLREVWQCPVGVSKLRTSHDEVPTTCWALLSPPHLPLPPGRPPFPCSLLGKAGMKGDTVPVRLACLSLGSLISLFCEGTAFEIVKGWAHSHCGAKQLKT